MRRAVALAVAALAAATAAPAGAQAQLPAKPQTASLDSDAPPGAPPHWLPNERWVMQHWLPYDETRLYRLLDADRGDVWRWLRDDTRNLADLGAQRGWEPRALARALVAPWRGQLREPHRLAVLEDRALRTLTQGHLSQHILFHSLHQDAIPDNAPAIFGVRSREEFAALRRSELSPLMICRLNGLSRAHAHERAVATLEGMAERGVAGQAIPVVQAQRLLARQLRQVPRWLGQTRYNGPPPLRRPRASPATASSFSANPVLAADGRAVAYEGYEARLPVAKMRGEINVLAQRWVVNARPLLVSLPPPLAPTTPSSSYNPSVSADGRWVAYESAEGNLNFAKRYGQMRVFVRDTVRGVTFDGSPASAVGEASRSAYNPAVSADGRWVAYESSEARRGALEVFVTHVRSGRTVRVAGEGAGEPRLSGDGRYVVYTSAARVLRRDLRTGRTVVVSAGVPAGADAFEPEVSADGRVVAFTVASGGRSAVWMRDLRRPAATTVAPRRGDGLAAGARVADPALSANGRTVAFVARRPGDGRASVWARALAGGSVAELVSRADGHAGAPADGSSVHPSLSADGRLVSFSSDAWNLSAVKCNAARGVFLRDRSSGTTALLSTGDGAGRWLGPAKGSAAAGDMRLALTCA